MTSGLTSEKAEGRLEKFSATHQSGNGKSQSPGQKMWTVELKNKYVELIQRAFFKGLTTDKLIIFRLVLVSFHTVKDINHTGEASHLS